MQPPNMHPYFDSYPYMNHFLSAYVHQDAFDEGETFADIVADFKKTSHEDEIMGLKADLDRFLRVLNATGNDPSKEYSRIFAPNYPPDPQDPRAWLSEIRKLLD